jgi:SAM-dependent methyltransferase
MIGAHDDNFDKPGESDRERWNSKYRDQTDALAPSPTVLQLAHHLPPGGSALDVAGGSGRHAIWLAHRGLEVTVADVSEVGLVLARERAQQAGVTVRTQRVDLLHEPIPPGPWSMVLCCCFLHRPVFAALPGALASGAVVIVVQPTVKNLTRHAKPPRPYLLEERELPSHFADFQILHYVEEWSADDRHDAVLVARWPEQNTGMNIARQTS